MTLLREARAAAATALVLSIFVNPTQFGPERGSRAATRAICPATSPRRPRAGTDVAFVPDARDVYPAGFQTTVEVRELARGLCGAVPARPLRRRRDRGRASCSTSSGPTSRVFGEKDYQQLAIIRRMVRDLDLGIEIVGVPTVREADGLAMSSRNAYLSPAERARALSLSRALFAARDAAAGGERDARATSSPQARARAGRRSHRLRRARRRRDAAAVTELASPGRARGRRVRRPHAPHRQRPRRRRPTSAARRRPPTRARAGARLRARSGGRPLRAR